MLMFASFSHQISSCFLMPQYHIRTIYFFAQLSMHPQANQLSPLPSTQLWHQWLGHPNMHELCHLQNCTTCISSGLHQPVHLLHHCKIWSAVWAYKAPTGFISYVDHLLSGSCFHLDFGFMHASLQSNLKIIDAILVVSSYFGYNSYLLITDTKTKNTWDFLTVT